MSTAPQLKNSPRESRICYVLVPRMQAHQNMRIEKTVFISYRRENVPWALAIFQNLTQHGFDVFFDFGGIASGDFERVILENIKARAHFIALLTPTALDKCANPGDWLRREIETALDERRNVVPLLLEGFEFGTPEIVARLTGRLAVLRNYNGLRVPADYFIEAMQRLREKFLNLPLDAVLHPASASAREVALVEQQVAATASAVSEKKLTAQEYVRKRANGRRSAREDTFLYRSNSTRFVPRQSLQQSRGCLHGFRQP